MMVRLIFLYQFIFAWLSRVHAVNCGQKDIVEYYYFNIVTVKTPKKLSYIFKSILPTLMHSAPKEFLGAQLLDNEMQMQGDWVACVRNTKYPFAHLLRNFK